MSRRPPKVCWGPSDDQHVEACRPARPLCRWMRKKQATKYAVCNCGTPPWPHRRGYCASGAGLRYMVRTAYGPPPDEAPGLVKSTPPDASVEVFEFFDALASGREPR